MYDPLLQKMPILSYLLKKIIKAIVTMLKYKLFTYQRGFVEQKIFKVCNWDTNAPTNTSPRHYGFTHTEIANEYMIYISDTEQ